MSAARPIPSKQVHRPLHSGLVVVYTHNSRLGQQAHPPVGPATYSCLACVLIQLCLAGYSTKVLGLLCEPDADSHVERPFHPKG